MKKIDQETTLLIQDVIDKALNGQSQPFRPIVCWSEFIYYHRCASANKMIIKTLKRAAKNLFKEYCRDVIAGISDITKLLAYEQLLDIEVFYETELDTIKRMLDDYDEYLGDWFNFFDALAGGRREV